MNYTVQRILGFLLLLAGLPLLILISLALIMSLSRQIIFRSQRLGIHEKIFTQYKFTTMRRWPERRFQRYLRRNPEAAEEWQSTRKLRNDPRLLSVGRFLRRFSLDELPQLWNVVRGDMTLVGPRPITDEENKLYNKYAVKLHSVKPGMTGLWQVSGRNELSYHRRIAINLYYIKKRSWALDLWILFKTLHAVIGGRGAY